MPNVLIPLKFHSSRFFSAVHAAALSAALAGGGTADAGPSFELPTLTHLPPEPACEQLDGARIPAAAIELETSGATVTSAELVRAGADDNENGEFCKIVGAIHPVTYNAPDIRFEVNLPSSWNGRSVQFGGGGLNGTLVTGLERYAKQPASEPTPLASGYVTLGSDSGHQSGGGFDGRFFLNPEALENFGRLQIKKTHDVAMHLVEARYGREPNYSYFAGGSQGGHEAFDAAQRYPEDYDGIIAGYPAHNMLMLHLSANNYARALAANDADSWLSPAETELLSGAVYDACDDLDGAADGIISNVAACRDATAELKRMAEENPLRCEGGRDAGEDCLSDAQIEALNVLDSPYELGFSLYRHSPDSGSVFPKWTPFEGSTFMDGGFPNLGASGPEQALQRMAGDATIRMAITQDLTMDPLDEFDPREWAGRLTKLAPILTANSMNLDEFRAGGGKAILFHGRVDDFITPYSSIQYYERLVERYGEAAVDEFFRFYTIPGMGHVTGPFNARISTLEALEAWVEQGRAPGELVAVDANEATSGRTRPVCPYPAWPRYRGRGSLAEASSFECVAEE